jgi:transposase-like protein
MSINMAGVKAALPVESGNGRRSIVRARSDVAEIVVDCVLRRRPFLEIAQRCAVNIESLNRFRKKFITPEVEKIVLIEANKMDADQLDEQVNKA